MSRKSLLTSPGAAWVAAALGAWAVAAACRSVQLDGVPRPQVLPSPSVEGLVEKPVVRIGIRPEVERVSIKAEGGVRVLARAEGRHQPYWRVLESATFLPGEDDEKVRLVETGEDVDLATVVPAGEGALLAVDTLPYRGLMEVRPAPEGSLTVVNVVNVEDYLRGVVPNELSPVAFPQIEAHKAQAVAARSWVLSHLGDYSSKGYDVCATQACQVYRGQATEHPRTDRAVAQTRGVVATWRGRPINAYYTATCGGHTEDGLAIFDDRAPYLQGVVCAPESSARHFLQTSRDEEARLSRAAAVLEALGALETSAIGPLESIPADGEVREVMAKLLGALDRPSCESPVTGGLARRGSFAEFAVASVCWNGRATKPAVKADGEDGAVALLLKERMLSPGPHGSVDVDGTMTRGEILYGLARLAERLGAPEWRTGEFAGLAARQMTVMMGEQAETFPVDPDAWLFRSLEGVYSGASRLTLAVGDEVSYVTREGRVVYLEVHQTKEEAVMYGQAGRHYRWTRELTPELVARKVARYGSVGQVQDLVPRRLGVSGRVIELEVQGTDGDLLLKGLKVRWGLGLRENLFVIDRETGDDGGIRRFVITGKGWGHGVGLCQVGAFGMAQAGSTYEGILHHYYTGIHLDHPDKS